MYQPIQLQSATTLSIKNSIDRSPLRFGLFLIAIALAWFALSPRAQAVFPAPDGGYPNRNTAEGENALFSLTSGSSNTAIGFRTLMNNTTGWDNTAIGDGALYSNTTSNANTAIGIETLYSNTSGFSKSLSLDA
jgi:hypothetical protein